MNSTMEIHFIQTAITWRLPDLGMSMYEKIIKQASSEITSAKLTFHIHIYFAETFKGKQSM